MTPYYDYGGVTIYHGDCRELLPGLAPVDHVITDPPYEAEAHTKQRRVRGKAGGVRAAPLSFAAIDEDTRTLVSREVARLAQRWALVFCQIEAAPTWRAALQQGGLRYMRTCIWVKPDGAPQFTGDRPGMGYETILAMHAEGASRWNAGGRRGVWQANTGDPDAPKGCHPTVKPGVLMRELIAAFTDEGETILDPFIGSGSTLRAAKDLGRRAIGIELEERYCEVAAKRLAQEVLFG